MDEKIIIKSQSSNILQKIKRGFITGLALGPGGFVAYFAIFSLLDATVGNKAARSITTFFTILIVTGILVAIAFGLLYVAVSKTSITVTNKRVFGCAMFGKRVDLPNDSISAVGTSALDGIDVATSSGTIKFKCISNKNEIHKCISQILIERQHQPVTATTIKQEIPQSNADELKKYKELLDSGVISQEEFDAKKKQILGL